jgi:hypothetical protein
MYIIVVCVYGHNNNINCILNRRGIEIFLGTHKILILYAHSTIIQTPNCDYTHQTHNNFYTCFSSSLFRNQLIPLHMNMMMSMLHVFLSLLFFFSSE